MSGMATAKRIPIWRKRGPRRYKLRLLLFFVASVVFVVSARAIPKNPQMLMLFHPAFNLLPGISGYFLAMAGIALPFMQEELKRLDGYRKTRLFLAALLFVIGLGAVISDSVQKQDDKNTATKDRQALTDQVSMLITQLGDAMRLNLQSESQATRNQLSTQITSSQTAIVTANERPPTEYAKLQFSIAEAGDTFPLLSASFRPGEAGKFTIDIFVRNMSRTVSASGARYVDLCL